MQAKLVLDNITKRFGDKIVFDKLTWELAGGQCWAVQGANGAGKSTLLKIIAGLSRASQGQVMLYLQGDAVTQRQQHMGLLTPEMAMYGDLTGRENLCFWLGLRGKDHSGEVLETLCAETGLSAAADTGVAAYSTGMRQRLKLAVLLGLDPGVWLLDEPSANLDEPGRLLVKNMAAAAVARGRIVIIATNDPKEASYAHRRIEL